MSFQARYVPPQRRRAHSNSSSSSSSSTSTSCSSFSSSSYDSLATSPASSLSSLTCWRSSPEPSPPGTLPPIKVAGAWRTAASPPPSIGLPGWEVIEPGMICFLPPTTPPASSVIHIKLAKEKSAPWGHPVVITHKWAEAGKEYVSFRVCTSFDGQHIAARKPKQQWSLFMLAENTEDQIPHPGTSLADVKPGSARFLKRTYVNLSWNGEFTIEYQHLDQFMPKGQTGQIQFSQASVQRILNLRA